MKTTTLEEKTEAARTRLNEVLDALDSKRHALKSPKDTLALPKAPGLLKRLALPLGAALGGFSALVASSFLSKRAGFMRPNPFAKVLQSVGVSLLSYGLAETVKSGVKLGAQE